MAKIKKLFPTPLSFNKTNLKLPDNLHLIHDNEYPVFRYDSTAIIYRKTITVFQPQGRRSYLKITIIHLIYYTDLESF